MSSMVATDSNDLHKPLPPAHRRDGSGELDVFEAARYFSSLPDSGVGQMRGEGHFWGGRKSLDMQIMKDLLPSESYKTEKHIKEKRSKQPSSPAGRLASFLNSLFTQASSKKKSKSGSLKDEEESPGGRRKRRSSISHFRGIGSTFSKSIYSSSSTSGFRTPPPCPQTPSKTYKDFRHYPDHKQVVPVSKERSVAFCPQLIRDSCPGREAYLGHSDEKPTFLGGLKKVSNDGKMGEMICHNGVVGRSGRERTWADEVSPFKSFSGPGAVDEGADSDSSSDLFELQNYDLGVYPNGLPVYETTSMDSIKKCATIGCRNI